MKRSVIGLLAISIAVLASMAQADTMWRWTDATGRVNYGQHPPAGVHAEPVTVQRKPSEQSQPVYDADEAALRQRLEELNQRQTQAAQARQQAETQREQQRREAEICQRTKGNLQALTERGRASVLEKGEYRALPEEERQSRIHEAEQFIATHCGRRTYVPPVPRR